MGLRSIPVVVISVLLCVALSVACVWLAPRLTSRPWGLIGRIWLQIASSFSAVLMVFIIINQQTALFPSWSDLLPAEPPQAVEKPPAQGVAKPKDAVSAPVAAVGPDLFAERAASPPAPAALPSPGERVQRHNAFKGEQSGLSGDVIVRVPESYFDPANATRTYPVIFALHGIPSGPETWLQGMGLSSAVDTAVEEKRLAEAIIVMPQVNFPLSLDTECVDADNGGPKVETFLTQDVARMILATYRTLNQRAAWTTMGFSSGGYCAAMVTMLHPQMFGSAVVFSGYFMPEFNSGAPYSAKGPKGSRYNLVNLAASNPPHVAIWAYVGTGERWLSRLQQFQSKAKPAVSLTIATADTELHQLKIWRAQTPPALNWLGSSLPPFAPAK